MSKTVPFWRRAVTMPPPQFDNTPLDHMTYLLNPVDFTLPEEYQNPAEYNSKMLYSLVTVACSLVPEAKVVKVNGSDEAIQRVNYQPLYPIEDTDIGIMDSDLIVDDAVDVDELGRMIAHGMVIHLRTLGKSEEKQRAMVTRLRTFSGLSYVSSTREVVANELHNMQVRVPHLAGHFKDTTTDALIDKIVELSKTNKDGFTKPQIMKELYPIISADTPSRLTAAMITALEEMSKQI